MIENRGQIEETTERVVTYEIAEQSTQPVGTDLIAPKTRPETRSKEHLGQYFIADKRSPTHSAWRDTLTRKAAVDSQLRETQSGLKRIFLHTKSVFLGIQEKLLREKLASE